MSDLGLLEREALKSCELRGHSMTPFTSFSDTRAVASCWRCHKEVMVNSRPLPNEIDIGGEAVALDCLTKIVDDLANDAQRQGIY